MAQRGQRGSKAGLDRAAVGIGSALGSVVNRIETWRRQRDEIAAEVRQVIAAGTKLLGELGHDVNTKVSEFSTIAAEAAEAARRKGGRPKGYKMSAATKRKLREAWQRRKAEAGGSASAPVKKAKKASRQMSAEAKERIAAAQRKRWAAYRAGKN